MSASLETDVSEWALDWHKKKCRKQSGKLVLNGQEYTLQAPAKLEEGKTIFPLSIARQLHGFPRLNASPAIPLDYLPSTWEECMAEFEASKQQIWAYPTLESTRGYDDQELKALAQTVLDLWDEMTLYLQKQLDHHARTCKHAKECIKGAILLGPEHALCLLHGGVFGDRKVAQFFQALNALCRACDFSHRREGTGQIYAIFRPLSGETGKPGSIAHLLATISKLIYVGMGGQSRPYDHFYEAAVLYEKANKADDDQVLEATSASSSSSSSTDCPTSPKAIPSSLFNSSSQQGSPCGFQTSSNSATTDEQAAPTVTSAYLRNCYQKSEVPHVATAHTDKSYLFAQLMEGCCIRYLCFDRCLDMANRVQGASLPPLMAYLLPSIAANGGTFDAIATLYSLHCMLVDKAHSSPRAVPYKEARSLRREHNDNWSYSLRDCRFNDAYSGILSEGGGELTATDVFTASLSRIQYGAALQKSTLLFSAYRAHFAVAFPPFIGMLPEASQKLVVSKEIVKYQNLYRLPVMEYIVTKKVNISSAECCLWVNRRYKNEGVTLTHGTCRAILDSFSNAGLLSEDFPNLGKAEEGASSKVSRFFRLTTERRTGPLPNVYSIQNCAAFFWHFPEATVLALAQTIEGSHTGDHSELESAVKKLMRILLVHPVIFEETTNKNTTSSSKYYYTRPKRSYERTYGLTPRFKADCLNRETEALKRLRAQPLLMEELVRVSLQTSDDLSAEEKLPEQETITNHQSEQVNRLAASNPPPSPRKIGLKRKFKIEHKCRFCSQGFASHVSLSFHKKADHPDELLQCDLCDVKVKTYRSLKGHKKKYHTDKVDEPNSEKKTFECSECGDTTTRRYALVQHALLHKPLREGDPMVSCPHCNAPFRSTARIARHIQKVHPGADHQWACGDCGKKFRTLLRFGQHRKSHTQIKAHNCPLCPKTFLTSMGIRLHISKKHPQSSGYTPAPLKVYQCPVDGCNYSATKGHLKAHIGAVHNGERLFDCPECDKKFSLKANLKAHIRAVHNGERPFPCPKCDLSFTAKYALNCHLRSRAHQEEPSLRCTWPNCTFTTSRKQTIVGHVRQRHFKLPKTMKEQVAENIVDDRNPLDYMVAI